MMRKAILAPMLVLAILLLTSPLHLTAIGDGAGSESYVVLELTPSTLSVINSAGARSIIYQFTTGTYPQGIAMDSSGNYIVTELTTKALSKITPDGERTVIYTFSAGPGGVAIDSSGNYIVTEADNNILSKITPAGERTVIYTFPAPIGPSDVAIDPSGNYIVVDWHSPTLSKITPAGERTVIYTFPDTGSGNEGGSTRIDSSGNYIVTDSGANILSKITPTGERTVIYTFPSNTYPSGFAIDSLGNYIITESHPCILSKITPTGERTVIYQFPVPLTGPIGVFVSSAPQLFFSAITDNGLTATWTQSADPSFAGYQLYQSSTHGELGALIGTNTNIADTSLTVTGLSPWTTYYFTLRVLGANGAHVDYGQRSMTTAKAFWQEDWFQRVMVVVVMVVVVAIAIYILYSRSKKKAKVT